MRTRQFNELEAARRALTFLTDTPIAPPLTDMPPTFAQQIQHLTTTIAQIDTQAASQTAATGAITDRVAATLAAAQELRSGNLLPIKKVATILVRGSTGASLSPNFAASIVIPDPRAYSALLTAASATTQIVTPHQQLFIDRGLDPTFLDRLTAQAALLSQTMRDTGIAKRTRVSATTTLTQLFQELKHTMQVLEIAVAQACKDDRPNGPATLTAWLNARSVRKPTTVTDIPFLSPPTPIAALPAPPLQRALPAPA